ncbi:hypothetical protein ES704_03560 [subsurface metagenome]|jgi:hypothetical protein
MKSLKSFEELMVDIEDSGEAEEPCTDEEAEKRVEVFLNGYRIAEDSCRRLINDLSFRLNNKFAKDGQAKELLRFYNERIGGFLDDLVY